VKIQDQRSWLIPWLVEQARGQGIECFSVGALIVREGRALLLRRSPGDFLGGLWDLPGGRLEPGETILDTLRREVVEETGLRSGAASGFVGSFDYLSASGRRVRQFNFVVSTGPGEPRLRSGEHDAAAWVGLEEVADCGASGEVKRILLEALRWGSRTRPVREGIPSWDRLLELGFPTQDFVIFGSAPMTVRWLRDRAADLDLVAQGVAWRMATLMGPVSGTDSGVGSKVRLDGGQIEVYSAWAPGNWELQQLIDSAEVIEGVRFARLDDVLTWKQAMGRPKDLVDAVRILAYLACRPQEVRG
jgi:8-oxo-dGTP diphosphatase